jgi:hypothetical protein
MVETGRGSDTGNTMEGRMIRVLVWMTCGLLGALVGVAMWLPEIVG